MDVDEPTRHRVYSRLREALGEEVATTLMGGLPPFPWSDVATRADLTLLRDELRGEMSMLRSELRGEMSELRGEMGELRGEVGELRGGMGHLEARLSTQISTQTRYFMVTTVGAVLTTGALAFAAAGLT